MNGRPIPVTCFSMPRASSGCTTRRVARQYSSHPILSQVPILSFLPTAATWPTFVNTICTSGPSPARAKSSSPKTKMRTCWMAKSIGFMPKNSACGAITSGLQMDETAVQAYPIVDWLPTHAKLDMEKYPKAGDPNPNVRIGVISSGGGKPKWISLTEEQDIYIPRFGWVRDGLLWAEVLNRTQDSMNLYFVDAHSGRSRKVLAEGTPDAWINLLDDFRITDGRLILKSGDRFVWPSWRDGHTHLYLYSFDSRNPLAAD